jgi:PA14 domain
MKNESNTVLYELMLIIVVLFVLMQIVNCRPNYNTYYSPLAPAVSSPIVPAPTSDTIQGLSCNLYDLSSLMPQTMPDFSSQLPDITQYFMFNFMMTGLIDFDSPQAMLYPFISNRFVLPITWFGLDCKGYLSITSETAYNFKLTSDDGSRLLIDSLPVVVNDGLHAAQTAVGSIILPPGSHTVELQYFQGPGLVMLQLLSNQALSFHQ